MEHGHADPLSERFPRALITGAGGQLGTALAESFPWAATLSREQWDVRDAASGIGERGLVLHAAAWTRVDDAEEQERLATDVNVLGTRHVVELGAPVVYFSTDYVFDGTSRVPYVESAVPRPVSVYGRTKLEGEEELRSGWVVRSSWLFGWTGHNFVRTMLRLGAERNEVRVVADQVGCPTYVGHLAEATRLIVDQPFGTYHVAAAGECSWAELAEAVFEEAGLGCRVVPVSTAELGRSAPRPPYSVLRSEKPDTPRLPHWRDGLRACLARLL
jgi:dTDP-4-dehydrorhamnose reductase